MILWDIMILLKGKISKIVLYTYDALLFDMDKNEEKELMNEILNVYYKYNLRVTSKKGINYKDIKIIK